MGALCFQINTHNEVTVKMAPTKKGKTDSSSTRFGAKLSAESVIKIAKAVFLDPQYTWVVSVALLLTEVVINILVIEKVKCMFRPLFGCLISPDWNRRMSHQKLWHTIISNNDNNNNNSKSSNIIYLLLTAEA